MRRDVSHDFHLGSTVQSEFSKRHSLVPIGSYQTSPQQESSSFHSDFHSPPQHLLHPPIYQAILPPPLHSHFLPLERLSRLFVFQIRWLAVDRRCKTSFSFCEVEVGSKKDCVNLKFACGWVWRVRLTSFHPST